MALSYQLSTQIKSKLNKIDDLRREISQFNISPQTDNSLRWNSHLSHIEGWAKLANQPLPKENILDILTRLHAKNVSELTAKVLNYKKALIHIREMWTANPTQVTYTHISDIAGILGVQAGPQEAVESLLNFLQTGDNHPVIQAGIIQLSFYPSRLAHLTSQLFLSRHGYDMRGWLNLENFWSQNKDEYLDIITRANNSSDATIWLNFFCEGVLVQLSQLKEDILSNTPRIDQKVTKNLSLRQKAILSYLEKPETVITNKQVQAMYEVSQVTASRDLAKLALAGLITSHGSGRSTAYTKT